MPGYLSGGIDDAGALTDQVRKTAAYNAFSNSYGPGAAYAIIDPQAALGAQEVAQRQQTNPIDVQQKQATLAGTQADTTGKQLANTDTARTQQAMAAYRAVGILKGQGLQPDGSVSSDIYDKVVTPYASAFGLSPDQNAQLRQSLATPGGGQHLDTLQQSLIGGQPVVGAPIQRINPDGTISEIFHTKTGGTVEQNLGPGVTPQALNAQTGQKRQVETARHDVANEGLGGQRVVVAQENAGTNRYRAKTTANNSLFGNPDDPGVQGGGNTLPAPTTDLIGAKNPPGSVTASAVPPTSLFAKLPPKGKQQAIGQASQIVNAGTQLATSLKVLDTVDKQISPYTAGTGALLKSLPGSAQADLKANLATLKAQGLMAWISSLKNTSGQTGIGRVLQSEANAAGNLYGNMEQDQSAKQLAFHSQLFRQAVTKLYQHSQQGFQAMYGVAPHDAMGTSDPMAPKSAAPADAALSAAYAKYGIK